ncbi:uncharacterized protein LOC143909290 [Arctopsyche grandis]|uniref:uncharacterized protein LOC143909290 n=1 Tax=Arctopsyche grandis TaxID=121162 RepID=UPI00406D960F
MDLTLENFETFIVDEVMTFCHSCAECMTTIRQEIKNKNARSFIPRASPHRKIEGKKMALIGGFDVDMASTIDIFDGLEKSWTLSKKIIGGKNSSNESVTSVEYIDLKSGQKHPLKPLNQARCYFSAVALSRNFTIDLELRIQWEMGCRWWI